MAYFGPLLPLSSVSSPWSLLATDESFVVSRISIVSSLLALVPPLNWLYFAFKGCPEASQPPANCLRLIIFHDTTSSRDPLSISPSYFLLVIITFRGSHLDEASNTKLLLSGRICRYSSSLSAPCEKCPFLSNCLEKRPKISFTFETWRINPRESGTSDERFSARSPAAKPVSRE